MQVGNTTYAHTVALKYTDASLGFIYQRNSGLEEGYDQKDQRSAHL